MGVDVRLLFRGVSASSDKRMDEEAEGEEVFDEELEAMKTKVKEMEDEAEKLRKIQEQTMEEQLEGGEGGGEDEEASAEADSRSVYVGQVEYSATPEELQEHFAGCGTVNRVTILCDRFRNPKGFAYIEFAEAESVEAAVALHESEFKERQLKVVAKRTNVQGHGKGGKAGHTLCEPFGKFQLRDIASAASFLGCCRPCPEKFTEDLALLQLPVRVHDRIHAGATARFVEISGTQGFTPFHADGDQVSESLPCCDVCPEQFFLPKDYDDISDSVSPGARFIEKGEGRKRGRGLTRNEASGRQEVTGLLIRQQVNLRHCWSLRWLDGLA